MGKKKGAKGKVKAGVKKELEQLGKFFDAVSHGDLGEVKRFVEGGIDVNVRDSNGFTALMVAARDGYEGVVKYLVETGKVDFRVVDNGGRDAFKLAMLNGRGKAVIYLKDFRNDTSSSFSEEGIKALIHQLQRDEIASIKDSVEQLKGQGKGVNTQDEKGDTLLMNAAKNGKMEVVKYLVLEEKADLGFKNKEEVTALMFAREYRREDMVEYLLAQEKNREDTLKVKNLLQGKKGIETLLDSVRKGEEMTVKYLVGVLGIDVNGCGEDGKTAHMLAVEKGNLELAKWLVEEGKADIEMTEIDKHLFDAIGKRNLAGIISLLEGDGGEINLRVKNAEGDSLLMFAVKKGYVKAVRVLARVGVDVNVGDSEGRTPLFMAKEGGMVRALVAAGGNLEITDRNGDTALLFTVEEGNVGAVEALVREGAKGNIKNKKGNTPLVLAANKGNPEIVDFFLDCDGIDVNGESGYGWTPLMLAAYRGDQAVVELLLQSEDIDVSCENREFQTASYYANKNSRKEDGGVGRDEKKEMRKLLKSHSSYNGEKEKEARGRRRKAREEKAEGEKSEGKRQITAEEEKRQMAGVKREAVTSSSSSSEKGGGGMGR
jgi:ankyrin repeat protein